MVRRIAVASLLVPAVVVSLGLISASPGLAETPSNCVSTTGARACYNGAEEKLTADDTLADGHHVRTYYSVEPNPPTTVGHFDNYAGNGSRNSLFFKGTIPDYGTICFRAATMEGDQIVTDGAGHQLLSARKCLPVK